MQRAGATFGKHVGISAFRLQSTFPRAVLPYLGMSSATTQSARSLTAAAEEALHVWRHRGLAVSMGLGYSIWRRLLQPSTPTLERKTVETLAKRFERLLQQDLANARAGYYPRSLLHQFPLFAYLARMPEALLELPRVLLRSYRGRYDDLPAEAKPETYPRYYRRTFHWQSDGWLSDRSARIYDASVEFLFGGTADVMRRMAIPPLVDAVAATQQPRILDVACGTGRFLSQLGRALPHARLYGLDMSPFYVRHARRSLERELEGDVALVAEDAARMPWADGFFDAVASVYLFHELPPRVRRKVAGEIRRVLKPGGTVVICDSAQLSDSAEIADALHAFPAGYHEPYYKGYLRDDLSALLRECGFEVVSAVPFLVSKVVVARKAE
jgi:ubiquinone/menaquinone biosynthesis C-methylase UbiE